MSFDYRGALSEGYSPTEIANYLAAHPELGVDVGGARQEGYSDADLVQHMVTKQPQDLAGQVIGAPAAGAISDTLKAIVPGSVQRGRAHMLEGMANTADVLGAPNVGGYLHQQVDKDQLNAPSSQEALGKAISQGNIGQAIYNAPGAVGEAIPQIAGAAAGALAGGAIGTAVGGPAGTAAGFIGGASADALLGIVTQAGDIAKERAKADGRETPNDQDIAVAVGSSAVIGALGRIGLGEAAGGLIANGVKSLLGRGAAGKVATGIGSAVAHGASDAVGAVGQQVAETAGTQQGTTVDPGAVAAQAVTGMGTRVALGGARLGTDAVTGKLAEDRAAGRQEALRQAYQQADPEQQAAYQNQAAASQQLLDARDADTQNPVKPSPNVAARTATSDYARQMNRTVDGIASSEGSMLEPDHVKQIKELISDARNSQRSSDPENVQSTLDALPLDDQTKKTLAAGIAQLDMLSTAGIGNRNTSALGKVFGTAAAAVGASTPHPFLGAQLGGNYGSKFGDMISRKLGWSDPALLREGTKAAAMLDAAGVAVPDTRQGMLDAIANSQDAVKTQASAMGLDPAKYGWSPAEAAAVARDAANAPTPVDSPKAIQDNLVSIQDRSAAQAEVARQASGKPAQAPDAAQAIPVAEARSTASSGAPSASADLSQLLPSRQPPQGFKSAMGERLPDWVYSVAHDVHQDLHLSGTPKALNYSQEVAQAIHQMEQQGYWDHQFSVALTQHRGRVSEGVYTAIRNQMLMNHGIDRRAAAAQGSAPMALAAE